MDLTDLRSDLESIANDPTLLRDTGFIRRTEALDRLEFDILGEIERLGSADSSEELARLEHHAEAVKNRLEQVNHDFFQRQRADIASGSTRGADLYRRIAKFTGRGPKSSAHSPVRGYDALDAFIAGLLLPNPVPLEIKKLEPEMVRYQPTPARIILELIESAHLQGEDVFYDLGSGLGQVPILVNLLTEATTKGVELEPAFCDYARDRAAELNLSRVQFINQDARDADYSDGTVFFMYTPFTGRLLDHVLEKLERETRGRTVRLYTHGPCTPQVSRQPWLRHLDPNKNAEDKLAAFQSIPNTP